MGQKICGLMGVSGLNNVGQCHFGPGAIEGISDGQKVLNIVADLHAAGCALDLGVDLRRVGVDAKMDKLKGVFRLARRVCEANQQFGACLREDHGVGVEFELSKQPVAHIDGEGVLDKFIEIRMNRRLSQPVWAQVNIVFDVGQSMECVSPRVPFHELFGASVSIITHGLAAHAAFDIAVIGELKIDVNGHFIGGFG